MNILFMHMTFKGLTLGKKLPTTINNGVVQVGCVSVFYISFSAMFMDACHDMSISE